MSDIIHTDGFPDGWFVQERDKDEALLCVKSIALPTTCICRKPKMQPTTAWLPVAREIATARENIERHLKIIPFK